MGVFVPVTVIFVISRGRPILYLRLTNPLWTKLPQIQIDLFAECSDTPETALSFG